MRLDLNVCYDHTEKSYTIRCPQLGNMPMAVNWNNQFITNFKSEKFAREVANQMGCKVNKHLIIE